MKKNKTVLNRFLSITILFQISTQTEPKSGLPIIMFHGMGSSCEKESKATLLKTLKDPNLNLNKNSIHCINYGPGIQSILTSMTHQSKKACELVTKNSKKWNLEKRGYILLGRSQGGLIARSVLMQCDIGKHALKLITMGTPNNGVSRIPYTAYKNIPYYLNLLIESTVYNNIVQSILGPAGYFKTLKHYSDYLKYSKFLPIINNEKEVNEDYRKRMLQLDEVVFVRYVDDDVVKPSVSEEFGYWGDPEQKSFILMKETDGYKKDLIGLKSLDSAGKVKIYHFRGEHLDGFKDDILENLIRHLS